MPSSASKFKPGTRARAARRNAANTDSPSIPDTPSSPAGSPSPLTERPTAASLADPIVRLGGLLIGSASSILLLGTLLYVSPRFLEPVYGNVFASLYFRPALVTCYALGSLTASWLMGRCAQARTAPAVHRTLLATAAELLAWSTLALPLSLEALRWLFPYRLTFGPWLGPHITQLGHAYPLAVLAGAVGAVATELAFAGPTWAAIAAQAPSRMGLQSTVIRLSLLALRTALAFTLARVVVDRAGFTTPIHTCSTVLGLTFQTVLASALLYLLDAASTPATPTETSTAPNVGRGRPHSTGWSRKAVPLVVALILIARARLREPVCIPGLIPDYHAKSADFTVLDRAESVTGWVSVIDNQHDGYLALRGGNSLIGGRWKRPTESIFLVFYSMEGARLLNPPYRQSSPVAKGVTDAPTAPRGLQIGLGVGIIADSLQRGGFQMDIVEIDPAVYRFAREYFGLAELHGVYLQDGRAFIEQGNLTDAYDYVFHDVFTGGSVPATLFSVEALTHIRRILKPSGILALNIVGSQRPPLNRALFFVWKTLTAVFPHVGCHAEESDDANHVVNMIFFASVERALPTGRPGVFRTPTREELGDVYLRREAYRLLRERPLVDLGMTLNSSQLAELAPVTDAHNPLASQQIGSAEQHWQNMNKILPPETWEVY
ncbi:hypothetical protein IWQ60_002311 [Tieghemiomyces parasiticus]|uniref:PABS domain-containing protein n=1 Tax=Tieghemiomyces parasiticus TaxID=78921 RepID=A0A9W8ACH8_9FUNG|nr:hypothetical protein IWQ60_002311 [Tieghemiomyces parasiticus]